MKEKRYTATVKVRLTEESMNELDRLAAKKHNYVATLVRVSIEEYLERNRKGA